jgi:hypothetical protein
MTPELTLLLVGAVVGLLGALTYSWRAYSDVQKLRADAVHMQAQASKQDNDNMAQLIAYTGRLTIAIDNISGALRGVEAVSNTQTEILKTLVNETKAMRVDMRAWPDIMAVEVRGDHARIITLLEVLSKDTHRQQQEILSYLEKRKVENAAAISPAA